MSRLSGRLRAGSAAEWLRRNAHVPVLLALSGYMLWTRTRGWQRFVRDGRVLYSSNDAWYHYRQVSYTVRHFPETMPFDPWTAYPTGVGVGQFGTIYDQAVALADALGHCHRHGAVHGGLDPKSVVYPGDGLTGLDEPILDNPGLMGVFRRYFEPADYLDPRFAAPEYFDDDFGAVDTATDVYGLGAVCYFLLTGRPPFDGSYGAVRRGVLSESPDAPSSVVDAAPADADSVLAKALAKRKLKRYDSVEAFAADLRRVRDRDC